MKLSKLYHFVSLKSQYGKDNIENAIVKNQVRFSSVDELNDPYECEPILVNDLKPIQFARGLVKL